MINEIEKYEKVLERIKDPVSRRVFGKIFLGIGLGAGAVGYSMLRPIVAEAAKIVDCKVTMFHRESTGMVGRVILQNKSEGRLPVTASQLVSIIRDELPSPGSRLSCLTFDDGYLSHFETITPFLEQAEVPGTFFVLDPVSWWGDRVHSYVTRDHVREMVDRGMEIQSHGISHQNLVRIRGTERYMADLVDSKNEIEETLQRSVDVFCYPFGAFDNYVRNDVENAGYHGAMSTISGTIQSSDLVYRLLRRRPNG